MKRANGIILTLALLMVAQLVSAQSKVKGTLKNDGHTMEWSVSGITVTKKGQPKFEKVNFAGTNDGSIKQEIEGTVSPGTTITADLKKVSGKKMPKIFIDFDYRKTGDPIFMPGHLIQLEDKDHMSKSFTVPSNAETVDIFITYRTPDPQPRAYALEMNVSIRLKVKGGTTATPVRPSAPVKKDTCRMRESKSGFFDLWGEVSIRCNDEEDDAYEIARLDDPIYENDRIRTKEDSGAVLVWELEDHENPYHNQTFTMGEESIIVIPIKPRDPCDIRNYEDGRINWGYVAGKMWAIEKHNFKRMLEGREPEDPCEEKGHIVFGVRDLDELPPDFDEEKIRKHWMELSGEQVYEIRQQIRWWNDHNNPAFRKKGTTTEIPVVYAIESQGSEVKINMLSGFMPIVSEKTKAFHILTEGQSATVGRNGKIVVKKIDVNKVAKKFGISNAALQGNTATVVKRYEIERAIVKYKVTKGDHQGVLAKAFDKYGRYERRELQMGNHLTIALLQDNVSYTLDRNTKTAKRTKDADLNFLNLNETLMKKLNLKKKGTKKVLGKDCILYEGKNVQFYVWKGLVMKKVQKESDGTTTIHEVTSIEEPTSIEAKTFKMPSGYTIKN